MMIQNLEARVVELGKIKIGGKSKKEYQKKGGGTFRPPEKWDHFVITTMERDSAGDFKPDSVLMQRLLEETGSQDGKLREIPIALMSDEIEDAFQSYYALYRGRKLYAKCDGVTCYWLRNREGQPINKTTPCNGEHEGKDWKPNGIFSCMIAAGGARFGGVYRFRTTSIISISNLLGSLEVVRKFTGGYLCGAPLRLVLTPREVTPEGGASTTVYVVHVELRGQDLAAVQRQVIDFRRTQQINARELAGLRNLLAAPEPEDEQADVNEEFYPDSVDAPPASRAREEPEDAEFEEPPDEAPEPPQDELPELPPPEPEPTQANGAGLSLDDLPF